MSLKKALLHKGFRTFCGITGFLTGRKWSEICAQLVAECSPVLTIPTDRGRIQFSCPSKGTLYQRLCFSEDWNSVVEAKKDYLQMWINHIPKGSVFWDCGANTGVYSLYAALDGNVKVVAFEPSAFNYSLIMRNVELNNLSNNIYPLCIALNDRTVADYFYMQNTRVGSAKNSFGVEKWWLGDFTTVLKHAMIGFTIDDLLQQFDLPFPNYMKIDVDGNEEKVLSGAKNSLKDPRLKSIAIELPVESETSDRVHRTLKDHGFICEKVSPHRVITDYFFYREGR